MITITGGSGFIGTNLCQELNDAGIDFAIVDKRPSPLFADKHVTCDICALDQLTSALVGDTIVHLAAEHRDDVQPLSRYTEVNVGGTENVIQVARKKGINRIVFTSTVAVYGFAPAGTGEDGVINPFNAYGQTKRAAEVQLLAWQAEAPDERSLTIIRPTVVFGPGNRGNVFNLLSFISSGKFLMIGNGENKKSLAYVGNIVSLLKCTTGFGSGVHLYNYVDKPDMNMNELVKQVRTTLFGKTGVGWRLPYGIGILGGHLADGISRLTGKTLPISAIRVKKFCATTAFSSKVHDIKAFNAPYSLEEGLKKTLETEFISPDSEAPVFYTE